MIRADLIGSNACSALGIIAHSHAPVLALCRRLIAAGHDPKKPLEAYRGNTLCLRVRSIGEAAQLTVRETTRDGRPRFVKLSATHFTALRGDESVHVGPRIAANGRGVPA